MEKEESQSNGELYMAKWRNSSNNNNIHQKQIEKKHTHAHKHSTARIDSAHVKKRQNRPKKKKAVRRAIVHTQTHTFESASKREPNSMIK